MPIESYRTSSVPTMERHAERVQLADELGFTTAWLRDVPVNVPTFGDAGQMFDPFTYLGFLAAKTIALGVASGNRPEEYPAFNLPFDNRGDRFRESFEYIQHMWGDRPTLALTMLPSICG